MQTSRGIFYPEPFTLPGAAVAHRIISATETLLPFWMESAKELLVTLGIHEFLQTSLTGSNNDLDFIARTPGSTPAIAIEFRDPAGNDKTLAASVHSYLTTALTGTNNDITVTAIPVGNQSAITLALVDPAANDATLNVTVVGNAITASLATDGSGVITTTADLLIAALNADVEANLLIRAARAASNNGTGVVTALAATALGGTAIVVDLATGSGGAITSTASQVKAKIEAEATCTVLVVVNLKGSDTGAGVVTALAHTLLAANAGSLTLDMTTQTAIDETSLTTPAGNYWENGAHAQQTTVGHVGKLISGFGTSGRYKVTLGGSTPVFAISINSMFRP